jgi:hypothetical protein
VGSFTGMMEGSCRGRRPSGRSVEVKRYDAIMKVLDGYVFFAAAHSVLPSVGETAVDRILSFHITLVCKISSVNQPGETYCTCLCSLSFHFGRPHFMT